MKTKLSFFFCFLLFAACKENKTVKPAKSDVEYLHAAQKKLTDVIVTDIFAPPVASRVYVYPLLAAYEAGKFAKEGATSITAKLKGFDAMPTPEAGKNYNFTIAAIKALCSTAKKVVFTTKEIDDFETKTFAELKQGIAEDVFNNSIAFGENVANAVIKRLGSDNYKETRGMARFEVKNGINGRWVPTPPDYADGVEPHWAKMKVLVMDTASQFRPTPPPQYSEDKNSAFWKELVEVHEISKTVVEERENIMVFWDDNPFVSRHKGHLMFQDKKMTPGGHWLAICQSFLKDRKVGFYESLQAYTLTSLALYEGFISCWDAKYFYASVRPETVISAKIDKQWHPLLVTPPFPSYTSGHSTVSAAAAETLTALFGDNQAYTDETEKEYGLPVRSFKSFREAAKEASISRVYAGIHYRSDCEKGNEQGTKVGQFVVSKLK
ncbi:MAG: vanadium-dependent haloperoxidase [Saprospiraceae bacterium]|nr:vanadium-dependent haloperoxidase [Saprospiraceae bacterium]